MNKAAPPERHSSWPQHDSEQIEAVVRVLQSGNTNYWTGSECRSFEREFAERFDMPFAISLANGTVALELALIAFGIGAGDEVIVPASSYIASAGCITARGATPVFADVEQDTQNVSAATIKPLITSRTRAIILVHLYGIPCAMDEIMLLRDQHDLVIIEDCAQAHGALYQGRPVGSLGDAAAFSFCQDKIISTGGEGGILLCRDPTAWRRAWSYKDHGKTADVIAGDYVAGPGIHHHTGSNWRMTEIQAAIGRIQLQRLDGWVRRRREIAACWLTQLADVSGLQLPRWPAAAEPAWYRFPIRLSPGCDVAVTALIEKLREGGIGCNTGICAELYREPALARFAPEKRLPNARQLASTAFSLSIDPTLTEGYVQHTANMLQTQFGRAQGRTAT